MTKMSSCHFRPCGAALTQLLFFYSLATFPLTPHPTHITFNSSATDSHPWPYTLYTSSGTSQSLPCFTIYCLRFTIHSLIHAHRLAALHHPSLSPQRRVKSYLILLYVYHPQFWGRSRTSAPISRYVPLRHSLVYHLPAAHINDTRRILTFYNSR